MNSLLCFVYLFIVLIIYYVYHYYSLKISLSNSFNNKSLYYISKESFKFYDKMNKENWNEKSICLFLSFNYVSQGYISTVVNNYNIFWPSYIGKKVIVLDK